MKTTVLTIAIATFSLGSVFAQGKKLIKKKAVKTESRQKAVPQMKFTEETHNFGTVLEGAPAVNEFKFVNVGKEPLVIQNARASCGCTVPTYSKEPVAPGKKGTVKVSYNTKGRVGGINKSITLTTNQGVKILYIKGMVTKAPTESVPQVKSMIRTKR